jgi:hypothetical protein
VKVTYGGRSLGTTKLKHGKATLRLPANSRGTYQLKVTYSGGPGLDRAARTVTVKVR